MGEKRFLFNKRTSILFFFTFVILIGGMMVSAQNNYNDCSVYGNCKPTATQVTSSGSGNVTNNYYTTNNYNADMNATQFLDNSTISEGWLSTLITNIWNSLWGGKTTDNLPQGVANFYDNVSWSEAKANTLYATIGTSGTNFTNFSLVSYNWTTNQYNSTNITQFESQNGALHIVESWLNTVITAITNLLSTQLQTTNNTITANNKTANIQALGFGTNQTMINLFIQKGLAFGNSTMSDITNITGQTNTSSCDATTGKLTQVNFSNGVLIGVCQTDQTGGASGNYFNQQLNNTQGVAFASINVTGNVNISGRIYARGVAIINYTTYDHQTDNSTLYNESAITIPIQALANYTVDCRIFTRSNGTQVGAQLNVTYPQPRHAILAIQNYTASSTSSVTICHNATNCIDDTGTGISGTTFLYHTISGFIENGASAGNFQVLLKSELPKGNVNVSQGSYCKLIMDD